MFCFGYLGVSVIAGLVVLVLLMPVNGVIVNKTRSLQIQQMKLKDERVKLMNEVSNKEFVARNFFKLMDFSGAGSQWDESAEASCLGAFV